MKRVKLFALISLLYIGLGHAWGENVTITKTIDQLKEANSWSVSSGSTVNGCYTSFSLDDNITISTSGEPNCGSIWGTDTYDWRLYQAKNGDITITAKEGCSLSSITLVYSTSNSGCLIYNSTTLSSNSSITVSGTNVTFTVGNTGSATNGQIRITSFSVTYTTGSSGGVTYTNYLTECAAASEYTVNNNLFGLESDAKNPTTVAADATNLTLTYSAAAGYLLPTTTDNITVKIGSTTLTANDDYTFNSTTGELLIMPTNSFTGDVDITIYAKLQPPTNVAVSEITATSATITWTKNSYATDYIITYTAGGETIQKQTGNVNTYTLTGLTPNTEYACTIKSIDSNTPKTNSAEVGANFTTTTAATYAITWNANGSTTTTQVTEGNAVVLPAAPDACSDTYTHFVGWFTEAAGTDGSPSATPLGTQVTAETVPTGNATYYAVFSNFSGDATDYSSTHTTGDNVTLSGGTSSKVNISSTEYTAQKAGTKDAVGSITIKIPANTTKLYFHLAGWNGEGGKSISVTSDDANVSVSPTSFKTVADAGISGSSTTYTLSETISNYSESITLSNVTKETTLTFANSGKEQRFVIWGANVNVGTPATGYISACGPHVGVSGDVRITSANGVCVDAYTKISVRATNLDKNTGGNGGTATAVSIKAESNNPNFKIKQWGTTGDGTANSLTLDTKITDANYEDSLCITYTPTEANTTDTATITLTAYKYGGTTAYATNTITVLGHSLPERFVIAAKGTNGWVALPNTLANNSSATVPNVNVEDINADVDDSNNPTKLTTAPSNVIYTAAARADSYKNNSQTGLRFTVDGGQFLQASKNETKVWLSTTGSQDMQSWTLRTEDFTDYVVRLDSGSRYNRGLSYYYKDATTERIGHYTTNTAIRFLPFDAECTRLLAPANLKATQVKSSAITLAWDAVAGAIGYAYSTDGGTNWTEMGNVLTYTITGLTAEKAYTIWVKGVVPVGDTDCSYHGTVSATTTNCDDVPYDISYTSDANSITLSWAMTSATATVQVFSDAAGNPQVGSYEGKTSPCTITGLTKATTYYVKILAGGSCSSALVEVSTERPQLDVVEWKPEGIDVAINTNEKISVVLENQVTKGTGKGNVAEDLFFSKYFEAHSTNKMLGIYNGTPNKIALADYSIAISLGGEFSLSRFGKETGYIDAGEEIILVQYSSENSAKDCAKEQEGWDTWFETQSSGGEGIVMQMSGRQSLGLYKNSVLIDIIGSSTNSNGLGNLNELDKNSCSTSKLSIDGIVVNDAPSFFSMQGDNISTEVIETDYALTTNRCLLVRKNSVTSGKDAVLKNVTTSKSCADISASFTTLGNEWMGLRIGSGKSTDAEIQEATCTGLSYLGHFDYSGYYTTYDSLTTVEFEESSRNPDGTVTIPINRMDTLACKGLKIIAADEKGNVLTTRDYKVPILVTRNATTSDQLFSHFGGDTCKKCDVVVRNNATLTKAADKTANDKPQVRDVMVYEGSSLVVPINTNYTVNSLSLRRREDAVAVADVAGTLNLSSTSDKPVYLDMRINAENWHWFTLPYDCAIKDVTWSNGQPAKYRTDWFLMYYDGAHRATGVDSGNWKEYEGDSIAAGQGFIIGIKGDGNDKHAFELRFPMAKEVITKDATNKTVPVYAYGAGTDVRPNHKGWNLVGNPYLNYYKKNYINSFDGLQLSELIYDDVTGWWSLGTNNLPYVVIPINFGWSAYQQVLVSAQDLLPFTSYFIQVGRNGDTDGKEYSVNFTSANRGKSAKAALMTSNAADVEEEPVITGIVLRNAQGESDETSLVIAEQFGSSYEMGADFFKWFGDYYKYYTLPVLYSIGDDGGKRAFNAVNEAGAKQSIPLGMYAARDGEYTFSLNTRSDLSRVDKVWLYDAESGRYTDLLREDYTFATTRMEGSGRFFLSVALKEKEITTSAANARYGDLTLYADKQTLIVRGLPEAAEVWVYDPSGKLLHHEQTRHYERHYAVPQQGTYLVRVESKDGAVTLRGVCR